MILKSEFNMKEFRVLVNKNIINGIQSTNVVLKEKNAAKAVEMQ